MWTWRFWKDAIERAVKTFAQTGGAMLMADSGMGLLDVSWLQMASVAGMAAVVSVLTSVGSSQVGDTGTASAVALEDLPKTGEAMA